MIKPHARPYITPARQLAVMLVLILSTGSHVLAADQEVLTEDGREVLLKEDGTWVFRSTDRYVNTKDGDRIRLKNDNTWEYIGKAPLTSKQQVRSTTLDIKLKRIVVETYKEKVHKNVRTETQTVFYLKMNLDPVARNNVSASSSDLHNIKVRDNKGNDYPVLSIYPDSVNLTPDSEQLITIRADGFPGLFSDASSIEIELLPGIFNLGESVILSQRINNVEKVRVEGFNKLR